MFSTTDGSLTLERHRINIGPNFKYQDFVESNLFKLSEPLIINMPYRSYEIKEPVPLFDNLFKISLFFKNNDLFMLEVYLYHANETSSWNNWSEESEMKKLAVQDSLLKKYLGPAPYIYKWGTVESLFDQRSGDTNIIITYRQ